MQRQFVYLVGKYFSWKINTKCGGETIPRRFSKKSKSLDQ